MSKSDDLKDFVTDIANSLRMKKGTNAKINPQDFSTEIANLSVGGNEKFKSLVDKSITEVTEEDLQGVTGIGNYAFSNCSSLTSIEIPDSVTYIGADAFYKCTSLTSVMIGNGVTDINSSAFEYCYSLTSVVIPDSVMDIWSKAFFNCSGLTQVTIGRGITGIGAYALSIGSSTNKATIRMLSITPPTIQSNTFDSSKLEKIIVPVGTAETYKAATNWSSFADYIVEEA